MANKKNSDLQKWLKRLISEEMIAHDLYIGSVLACKDDQRDMIRDMFVHIAEDELDDHAKNMIEWALENGYVFLPLKIDSEPAHHEILN